ncbi:hypothetical protein GCM10027566_22740 [Arachidicoccus ginsenosidivorans]|jgi:hypothetical protein|uniref:Uncharacterized protein n=1 Tax=Arachidicoccus ginsenosidivorans TaxID=496057 RepID=A0A5B8VLV8_9BACT|nr:hypothetical protein [Arachidicoccus ginsenosidivorans]QEC71218.1 hypothetical protein FSB73_05525 [Arachidicoccus ginsenosidivorans]
MRKSAILVFLFSICFATVKVQAQWKKNKALADTKIWRYDIECAGLGKQGSKLVKVWSYSKNPKHAIASAMRNAVHGIIFKGYAGGGQGCTAFKPLVRDPAAESQHQAFFDAFFAEGGEYLKYVSSATDGQIAAEDRLKVSKREYKIGAIVTVMTDLLRKRLEKEGIVRALNAGF